MVYVLVVRFLWVCFSGWVVCIMKSLGLWVACVRVGVGYALLCRWF